MREYKKCVGVQLYANFKEKVTDTLMKVRVIKVKVQYSVQMLACLETQMRSVRLLSRI